MPRTISQNLKVTLAKASGQVTGSGTGTIFDTQGFHSVMFALLMAAVAAADEDNTLAFSVEEGDSALGYDFEAVAADRLLNQYTLDSTGDASAAHKFGVTVGTKRYMRLKWTETGTVDATFGAIAVLGHPEVAPVS